MWEEFSSIRLNTFLPAKNWQVQTVKNLHNYLETIAESMGASQEVNFPLFDLR